MKRLFLIKAGTDLLPYLMPKLNQVHVPKKKRAIMKAGTDLVLIYSKGKCLVQRADIRTPYRHMIFTFNITDWNKYIYPMELTCLSTQGLITDQVDGLAWVQPETFKPNSVNVKTY